MVPVQIILKLNLEYLKVPCWDHYYFLFILMILKEISNPISNFLLMTMLFSIVKDPVISGDDLNHGLDINHQWAHQWKMEFNPDPTKQATEVLFSCKKSQP